LSEEVEFLFLSLGYVPTLHRRRAPGLGLTIHGTQDLEWLATLFCDRKRERLETYLGQRTIRGRASAKYRREGELHLAPVQDVEGIEHRGYVYSIESLPTHTFATSNGVVVHNCVPIDPQYLAWRVRGKTGHQFRMLETAADI